MLRLATRRFIPLVGQVSPPHPPLPPVTPIVNCRVRKFSTEPAKMFPSEEYYRMQNRVTELEKKIADMNSTADVLEAGNPDKEMTKIVRTLAWASAFTFCFYTFCTTNSFEWKPKDKKPVISTGPDKLESTKETTPKSPGPAGK